MDTHGNRALFSRAMVKVAACVVLTAGLPQAMLAETGNTEAAVMAAQQTRTVTGQVVDSRGETIIGANIVEKGSTANGTITDFDGKFTLKVAPNATLVISYIGYKTIEIKASEIKAGQTITLQENAEMMDEVVVIGYGTQRKGDVTSAISSVKAEDFTVGKVGDAADLIKGKVAGLSIAKGSGDPNSTSTIRLRGVISVNGSTTPLVLIDGVEGDLTTVAPENIASIDVLKDASAAAIYGTRGANGVIIITTKTGHRGEHATVNYSGYVAAAQFGKKLEFMDATDVRAGKTSFNDQGYDTDWLDAVSRTGFTHNHNISVTGGTEKTTYSADFTYRKEDGVIMNTFAEDMRMRFDVSHWFLNDMLRVNLNMVQKWHKNSATNASNADVSNIYRQAIARNPTEPIYNEDGSYYENFGINYYYNPVAMLEERLGDYTYSETRATGNVTFEPIKGWQTNLMLATSRFHAHDEGYNTATYYGNQLNEWNGYAYHTNDETRTDNLEITSKYDLNIGKHRMNALVGYSYQYYTYNRNYANNYDFPSEFFTYNNLGLGQALLNGRAGMGSDKNENTLIGFFARVSYAYDNRYLFTVSLRQDGSSRFASGNQWGVFPSFSAAWNMSSEKFLNNVDWLSMLKLRLGWGLVGNQAIPEYAYLSIYNPTYSNGNTTFVSDGRQGNPDITWEKQNQFNVGVDASILNDRLSFSADYFYTINSDLLMQMSLSQTTGFNNRIANVAKLENQGVELSINAKLLQRGDWTWNFSANISHDKNKVKELYDGLQVIWSGNSITSREGNLFVGEPVNTYHSFKARIAQQSDIEYLNYMNERNVPDGNGGYTNHFVGGKEVHPGDLLPEDRNGDGKITYEDDMYIIGRKDPKFYGGFSTDVTWKDVTLSATFSYSYGARRYSSMYESTMNLGGWDYCSHVDALDRWTPTNTDTDVPRAFRGADVQRFNIGETDWVLLDASYLRLSALTLSWNLPTKWISPVCQNLRVYATCNNLFTWTPYKGYDPETGEDYPSAKMYVIGVNATF